MTDADEAFDDLRGLIDRAHRETPLADDVPASVWSHVRAEFTANKGEENLAMSMNPALSSPVFAKPMPPASGSSRFSHIVATLAIVSVLAFAGWFAAMNLPPANDGRQFAVMQASPSAVSNCDVEPLTVDRVMEIVKNPIPFMTNGAAGDPVMPENTSWPGMGGMFETSEWVQVPKFDGKVLHPEEEQFEAIGSIADAYLKCLVFGTQGQAWTFYSPVHIQQAVLGQFPVFATEEEVRAYVETQITQPAYLSDASWSDTILRFEPAGVSINPDYRLSISRAAQPQAFSEVMSFGIKFVDSDGAPIYLTNGMGSLIASNQASASYGLKINVGYSTTGGAWFVVPSWW